MDDIKMIKNPIGWPRWPCLPLKRYTAAMVQPEFGFILSNEGMLTTIHMGSIYDPTVVDKAARRQLPHKDYTSAEAILADGWRVD